MCVCVCVGFCYSDICVIILIFCRKSYLFFRVKMCFLALTLESSTYTMFWEECMKLREIAFLRTLWSRFVDYFEWIDFFMIVFYFFLIFVSIYP